MLEKPFFSRSFPVKFNLREGAVLRSGPEDLPGPCRGTPTPTPPGPPGPRSRRGGAAAATTRGRQRPPGAARGRPGPPGAARGRPGPARGRQGPRGAPRLRTKCRASKQYTGLKKKKCCTFMVAGSRGRLFDLTAPSRLSPGRATAAGAARARAACRRRYRPSRGWSKSFCPRRPSA